MAATKETINVRAEVESVLGRELIGHEKAIVIHLRNHGMMNPIDIARNMLERHRANAMTQLLAVENQIKEIDKALLGLIK